MLVAVGNGPSFGGGLRITEGALLDDGLLDVVIIKPMSKAEPGPHLPEAVQAAPTPPTRSTSTTGSAGHGRRARHRRLRRRRAVRRAAADRRVRRRGALTRPRRLATYVTAEHRRASPSERYADYRKHRGHPVLRDFAALYDFPLDDFQVRACHEIEDGRGVLVAAPDRLRQDRRRRVRRPPGAGHRPQVLLHDADQGAVEPEVQRPGRPLRRRPGRPAHRRQHRQRRGAGRGDDHRGAAQHAVRRLPHAAGARLRRDGRGALPRRPRPRRGVGGGDHPPARVGGRWSRLSATVSNAEEFGEWLATVRGETTTIVEETPAGAALPARHGRAAAARPVRLLRRRRGRRASSRRVPRSTTS